MNTTNANQRITAAAVRSNLARTYTTITEAATELGISRSTLSRKVNGHTPFKTDEIRILAGLMGIQPAELLGPDQELREVAA